MTDAPRKLALKPLLDACCKSVQETLQTLVGKKIQVTPGALTATTPDEVAANLPGTMAVVRGALDKDFAGKTLLFLCEAGEATTLAGALMMTPDDVLSARRSKGVLEGEELEAFAEVANVLCSGIDAVLREHVGGQIGVRKQDHSTLAAAASDTSVLGSEPLYAIAMKIAVDKLPATTACILLDRGTAERWNGGPLKVGAGAARTAPTAASGSTPAVAAAAAGAEGEEDDGPAAPIRGRLAAFLIDVATTNVLRRTCRRVGLELEKFPRGDVPNPAALKDATILIEVAPTEEKRFEWCRRIKTLRPQTKVVLLLVVPSRPHVLQAARAGADVVLGHPVSAQLLTAKLNALLEPAADELQPQSRTPTK